LSQRSEDSRQIKDEKSGGTCRMHIGGWGDEDILMRTCKLEEMRPHGIISVHGA
jgi:hypothetical protein